MIRGSITRLGDKLSELEAKERSPMNRLTTKRMQQRIGKVDEDFKRLHFAIVDLLEQQGDLEMEQAIFDEHEDTIGDLGNRLQQLVLQDEPTQKELTYPLQKGLHVRLTFIDTELRDIASAVETIERGPELDHFLLEQHEEQLSGLKSELSDVSRKIATLEEDETGLKDRRSAISKTMHLQHVSPDPTTAQ